MPLTPPDRPWAVKPPTPRAASDLAKSLGVPRLMGQLLCHRGYLDPDEARSFLSPRLAELPPPGGMLGLTPAVELLAEALEAGRTIGVAGDYDADGVTATALMVDFLGQCDGRVVWDLPHRQNDGYGFSPERAARLAEAGAEVVVTVDCGISDHAGVARARELGQTVVVTDHHQLPPGPVVPADAVVNPQQDGCPGSRHLAGVGVAFYLAAGLRAHLRERGFFQRRPEPNLRHCLDLVAVGTQADVVPLVDHNRILVSEGLAVLNQNSRPGLAALAQVAGVRGALDWRDLGFVLAPRLNAAGRVEHPRVALELLLCREPAVAAELARELDRLNRLRRDVEKDILEQAVEQLPASRDELPPCVVLAGEGWHRGVLGLVASRLVELTGRPALAFSLENGLAVGSGRSVPGFHLQRALAGVEPLLSHYGGHAMAAGATCARDRLPALAEALAAAARAALPDQIDGPPLIIDAEAALGELGPAMWEPLERLAPFGAANPEPRLAARSCRVASTRLVGERHLKLLLEQDGRRLEGISFFHSGLEPAVGELVDLAFTPRLSNFGGRHLEMVLEDIRPASAPL